MTYFDVFPVVLMGMVALNYVLPSCAIAKVAESKIQKWILWTCTVKCDDVDSMMSYLLKVMTK